MASDYIRMVENQAKKDLNKLNKSQQEAVIDAYRYAGRQLANGYKGSRDNTATKALYASYTKKIAADTEEIIKEYGMKGARIYLDVEKLIMTQAFQQAGLDTSLVNDKFENIIGKLGMESVKNVIGGGIYKDGAGLSSRIWQSSTIAGRSIQEVIAAGLAQDMSATKLSKLLEAYVNPTARKVWDNDKIKSILGDGYEAWNKNLEYNALRLARTTLSHTATMSMRQARKVNPYATKIKWHSVHAAGRTCPTCEEMDGNIYKTEECPFDHPNGMCYQTHEMEKSLDEIADELAAWCKGEENEMLDEWWENLTGEKPGYSVKEALLYELITRQDYKTWAQNTKHEIIHTTKPYDLDKEMELIFDKSTELSKLVADGKITQQQMIQMSKDYVNELRNTEEFRINMQWKSIYEEYVGTSKSFTLNELCRQGKIDSMTDVQKNAVKALDDAISMNSFEKPTVVRRFIDKDYLSGTFGSSNIDDISKSIGNVYENKQYMSTTIDSNPYFSNRPAIMTVQCEKGTHAFPTTNYDEGEIILGRNNRYELIDVVDHSGDNPLSLIYEEFGNARTFNYSGLELVVRIIEDGV